MRVGVEQGLLLALPVNVYEKRSEVAQQRLRGELVVDEYLISPVGGSSRRMMISFASRPSISMPAD